MKPKLIRFTAMQIKALEKLGKRSGLPVSEIVRRALDTYLKDAAQ